MTDSREFGHIIQGILDPVYLIVILLTLLAVCDSIIIQIQFLQNRQRKKYLRIQFGDIIRPEAEFLEMICKSLQP